VGGEFADFVEEECAVVGEFKQALFAAFDGAGEGAFLVAKKFALKKGVGDGCAVKGDKDFVGPGRGGVDGAGEQFLACAGFAADEHGGVAAGDGFGDGDDLAHGVAGI
jgi:hypothetical protein